MGNSFSRVLTKIQLWMSTSAAEPEMNREMLRSGVEALTVLILSIGGIRSLRALCAAEPDTIKQLLESYHILPTDVQTARVIQVRTILHIH